MKRISTHNTRERLSEEERKGEEGMKKYIRKGKGNKEKWKRRGLGIQKGEEKEAK